MSVSTLNEKIVQLENDLKNAHIQIETLTEMVEDLIKSQENHQRELKELKTLYEDKLSEQASIHELMVQELIDSSRSEVAELNSNHESLVLDLVNSHEQQIRELKDEFAEASKVVPELKDDAAAALSIPGKIWKKFKDLDQSTQGAIVIGITVLGTLVGFTSWKFIYWAWPKLVAFSSTINLTDIDEWLQMFMKTSVYATVIQTLSSGKPLTKNLLLGFGQDILSFAISQFGPALFKKNAKSIQTTI